MRDDDLAATETYLTTKRRRRGQSWIGLLSSWARMFRARDTRPASGPVTLFRAGWMPVAKSSEVGRKVLVRRLTKGEGTATVLLWRTGSARPVAMDSMCPHRAFSMEDARLRGDALECPLHHRLFGPTGSCINRPDTAPVKTITVCEVADHVWLRL